MSQQLRSQIAKSVKKPVIISAAAGSGKTTLLVSKILHGIEAGHYRLDNILAITFTENAATHMKSRIRANWSRGMSADHAEELAHSSIMTIHSFCMNILKDYPLECAVDPNFSVQSEAAARVSKDQVLDMLFESRYEDALWMDLLASYSESVVREFLFKCLDWHLSHAQKPGLMEESSWRLFVKSQMRLLLDQAHAALSEISSTYLDAKATSAQKDIANAATELLRSWPNTEDSREAFCLDVERRNSLSQAVNMRVPLFKPLCAQIRKAQESMGLIQSEVLSRPYAQKLSEVYADFYQAYQQRKTVNGLLDFDDLTLAVYEAVCKDTAQSRALRKSLDQRYQAVFIDEYQDTSLIQVKLLDRLFSHKKDHFIVGDHKQSIYGFRHARPDLFHEKIQNASKQTLSVELNENFRSTPSIIRFVNAVVRAHALGSDMSTTVKNSEDDKAVEIMHAVRSEDVDLDTLRVLQARAIAKKIKQLCEVEVTVPKKPCSPSEIAILFRYTTNMRYYEKALFDEGIAYHSVNARGFFQRPEIVDVVGFLQLLLEPDSDIALAGVLLSPFFHMSADGLYLLAAAAKKDKSKTPLYTAISCEAYRSAGLSIADSSAIDRFVHLHTTLKTMSLEQTPLEVLEKILRETAYEEKISARGRQADQPLANLHKLRVLVHDFQKTRGASFHDLVAYLRLSCLEDEKESQETVGEPDENCVRLMTVHASKGLEFPVVFLAEVSASTHNDFGPLLIDEKGNICAKAPDAESEMLSDAYAWMSAKDYIKENSEQESYRLLYVALTRAMKHLLICTWSKESDSASEGESNSWTKTLLQAAGLSPAQELSLLDTHTSDEAVLIHILKDSIMPALLSTATEIFVSTDDAPVRVTPSPFVLDFAKPSYAQTQNLSVTTLLQSSASQFQNALDEDELYKNEAEIAPESNTDGASFGNTFHDFAEQCARWRWTKASALKKASQWAVSMDKTSSQEFLKQVKAFTQSDLYQAMMRSKRMYPELPFVYKTPYGLLKGRIDLVIQALDGGWWIVDYKTHASATTNQSALCQQYEPQLKLYSHVFKELTGKQAQELVLYFSQTAKSFHIAFEAKELDRQTPEWLSTVMSASLDKIPSDQD